MGYCSPMGRDSIRDKGLRDLGATERLRRIAYDANGVANPYPVRCKLLIEYKAELKKHHRKVSLECHPDRTLSDPDETRKEKEARFNEVTRAVNFLMGIAAQRPKPPPVQQPVPQVVIVMNVGGQSFGINDLRHGTQTSQTRVDPGYWPWHD